jgi:hypothetical protein
VHTLESGDLAERRRPDLQATGASMAPTIDQMIASASARTRRCRRSRSRPRRRFQRRLFGQRRLLLQLDAVVPQRDTPLPMEFNPRKVFMQLFGAGDTPEEREAIARQTISILDLIAERTQASCSETLGPSDRVVLERLPRHRARDRAPRREGAERDLSGIDLPDAPIGELDAISTSRCA